MSSILVTGGSGFIGGLVVADLVKQNHTVYVIDRSIKGWVSHIIPDAQLIQLSYSGLRFRPDLQFDTVIHLAAEHNVPDSVLNPKKYYDTNVTELQYFLDILVDRGLKKFIFASSASVYGNDHFGKVNEQSNTKPMSPYGDTKIAGENMINAYASAYGFHAINLRFFQPSGADPFCESGYVQDPPTHIIPVLCHKIHDGEKFVVNGIHHPTPDGTCLRDYVHVSDVASAVTKTLEYNNSGTFNIAGGNGVSVLDIINIASNILGKEVNYKVGSPRTCDPARLVADISYAKNILGWEPKYTIEDMIFHAWNWQAYKDKK